jgi:uncharacterized protein (TIGR02118 family)
MKTSTILLLLFFGLSFSCLKAQTTSDFKAKKGMIKVTVLYPNGEGKTFDMEYYKTKHMPLMAVLFADAVKCIAIDKGVSSGTPGTPVPFLAIGYLYFDSVVEYEKALAPNVERIRNDFPKYTNVQPVIQISEVLQ